jgi:Phosphoribosylaminoimidazole (AIR) synthetase
MKPTRIYVDIISSILTKIKVKGMAHITGGGLVENIPRILPKGMGIEIYHSRIPKNKLFKNIQDYSGLNFEEMIKVFNMGIGFVICINEKDLGALSKILNSKNEKFYVLGNVVKGNEFKIT